MKHQSPWASGDGLTFRLSVLIKSIIDTVLYKVYKVLKYVLCWGLSIIVRWQLVELESVSPSLEMSPKLESCSLVDWILPGLIDGLLYTQRQCLSLGINTISARETFLSSQPRSLNTNIAKYNQSRGIISTPEKTKLEPQNFYFS